MGSQYISYGSNWTLWLRMIDASAWFTMLWSTLILLCEALYVWATISFGTRWVVASLQSHSLTLPTLTYTLSIHTTQYI